MIGVEQQEEIERFGHLGHRDIVLIRLRKHHVQEVIAERELLLREHEGQSLLVAVDHRDHRADLGDRDRGGVVENLEVLFKVIVGELRMIRRQGGDHGREHGHRRRAGREAFEDFLHLRLDVGVLPQAQPEFLALGHCGQLAVNDEIGGLHEIAMARQLLDRIATVPENSVVAVEEGDLALTGAGVAVTLIVGDVTGGGAQRARIDRFFAFGADNHGQGVFFVVDLQRGSMGHNRRAKPKPRHWQNKDGLL